MKPGRNDPCSCGSGKKYKHCCAQKASEASPTSPIQPTQLSQAVMNQLVAMFNFGRYAEMEVAAQGLIDQHPASGFAWKAFSTALQMQGKDALSALQGASRLLPNDTEILSNLGNALLADGRLDDAATSYRQAVQINPKMVEAHCNLGNVLRELGQPGEAAVCCNRALAINPNFVMALNNLGNALSDLGQLDAAVASYRKALAIEPHLHQAHVNLGLVLRKLGRIDEAESCCRTALEIAPNSLEAILFMAELTADKGRFSDSEALFRHVIGMAPATPEAWAGIARVRKMTVADGAWLDATQKIIDSSLPLRKEVNLRFAIGKYYDDVKDFDQAFFNYQRANALSKQVGVKYNKQQQAEVVDMVSRIYDGDWINRHRLEVNTSVRPVFIVGMPRSGTSLTEQILASHRSVFGAGELPFWNAALARFERAVVEGENSVGILSKLSNEYIQVLQKSSIDALRVIDKMPSNFQSLGLIHAAFPHARIIHMQRNPIDTCLSINFQNFDAMHSYANDLDDLAHYYAQYLRMMEHWRRVLPANTMLDVPYEALVGDQEGWTRNMLAFIDLPWDQNCLDFHLSNRAVGTASNWQVRQKINQSSVNRWRNYEKFVRSCQSLMELV
jgi:tetratricopeptide (TPR) repeat protein